MEDVDIIYDHLVNWYSLWPFGIFLSYLVYFSPFWYVEARKIWQPCSAPLPASLIPQECVIIFPVKRSYFFSHIRSHKCAYHKDVVGLHKALKKMATAMKHI
jgi:hypothetical protein